MHLKHSRLFLYSLVDFLRSLCLLDGTVNSYSGLVRNRRVLFDKKLSFAANTSAVIKRVYGSLRRLWFVHYISDIRMDAYFAWHFIFHIFCKATWYAASPSPASGLYISGMYLGSGFIRLIRLIFRCALKKYLGFRAKQTCCKIISGR